MEIKQNTIDGLVAMSRCEVVEIRNSADADGFPCSRTASTQCSDCGSELCESHTETRSGCHAIFCPSCFLFHRAQHSKPAHGERRGTKKSLGPNCGFVNLGLFPISESHKLIENFLQSLEPPFLV